MGERIAQAITDNINRFVLPAVAGQGGLVPLAVPVSPEFSVAALRQAAHGDRLRAIHTPDGAWHSTKQDVTDYRRNRGKDRR